MDTTTIIIIVILLIALGIFVGTQIGGNSVFLNIWTGVASTMQCEDFYGNDLFYQKPDRSKVGVADQA